MSWWSSPALARLAGILVVGAAAVFTAQPRHSPSARTVASEPMAAAASAASPTGAAPRTIDDCVGIKMGVVSDGTAIAATRVETMDSVAAADTALDRLMSKPVRTCVAALLAKDPVVKTRPIELSLPKVGDDRKGFEIVAGVPVPGGGTLEVSAELIGIRVGTTFARLYFSRASDDLVSTSINDVLQRMGTSGSTP